MVTNFWFPKVKLWSFTWKSLKKAHKFVEGGTVCWTRNFAVVSIINKMNKNKNAYHNNTDLCKPEKCWKTEIVCFADLNVEAKISTLNKPLEGVGMWNASACCACFRLVRRDWCWRSVMAGWTWFRPCWLTGPTSTSRTTRVPRRWCAPASMATSRSSNCCWLNPAATLRWVTVWVVISGTGHALLFQVLWGTLLHFKEKLVWPHLSASVIEFFLENTWSSTAQQYINKYSWIDVSINQLG